MFYIEDSTTLGTLETSTSLQDLLHQSLLSSIHLLSFYIIGQQRFPALNHSAELMAPLVADVGSH